MLASSGYVEVGCVLLILDLFVCLSFLQAFFKEHKNVPHPQMAQTLEEVTNKDDPREVDVLRSKWSTSDG